MHDLVNPQIPQRAQFENFGSHELVSQLAPSSPSAQLSTSHKSHQIQSWMDFGSQDYPNYFSKFNRNEIEKEFVEAEPIDLSDDIAINEMLADQGVAASDMDVEVFTVDNVDTRGHQRKYHYSEYNPIK